MASLAAEEVVDDLGGGGFAAGELHDGADEEDVSPKAVRKVI